MATAFVHIGTQSTSAGMVMRFGTAASDPIPFLLTVSPEYVAHKTHSALPLKIQEMQHYCADNLDELFAIALNCKQRGLTAEKL